MNTKQDIFERLLDILEGIDSMTEEELAQEIMVYELALMQQMEDTVAAMRILMWLKNVR